MMYALNRMSTSSLHLSWLSNDLTEIWWKGEEYLTELKMHKDKSNLVIYCIS